MVRTRSLVEALRLISPLLIWALAALSLPAQAEKGLMVGLGGQMPGRSLWQ